MLYGLATLLGCQLAGEAVVRLSGLPLSGPVVGMVLLAGAMLARVPFPEGVDDVADGLLKHLSLLFVPAGVGIVQHLGTLSHQGLRLMLVILVSTVVTIAVTAVVFAALARSLGAAPETESREEGEP